MNDVCGNLYFVTLNQVRKGNMKIKSISVIKNVHLYYYEHCKQVEKISVKKIIQWFKTLKPFILWNRRDVYATSTQWQAC